MTQPRPESPSLTPPLLLLYGAIVTAVWLTTPAFEIVQSLTDLETAKMVDKGLLVSVFLAIAGSVVLSIREGRKGNT